MNPRAILITLAAVGSTVMILFILLLARPEQHKNGFNRQFSAKPFLTPIKTIEVKSGSLYFSGHTRHHFYLSDFTHAEQLLQYHVELDTCKIIQLQVPGTERVAWKAMKVYIDSPAVFAFEGIVPSIFKGTVQHKKLRRTELTKSRFNLCQPISGNSAIVRAFDPALNQNMLKRIAVNRSQFSTFKLKKQKEGKFSTDGMLLYSPGRHELVYVYYYRNEYLGLDTLLRLKYQGNTIDTIKNPELKIGKITSENTLKLLGSPVVVNKKACIDISTGCISTVA